MQRVLLAVFAVVVGSLGVLAEPAAPADAQSPAPIEWRACGGAYQCATYAVPLDYAQPGGRTIDLALLRLPARDQSRRVGVMMANPGGPGASAIDFVRLWANLLNRDLRDRFDIVTFDPRGVGQSSPILCHETLQEVIAGDPTPDNAAEWAEARDLARAFAEGCERAAGEVLPHVGTNNVARDMDTIRAALGEEKLTYIGYSYGTSIGAVYADMFPERVRAFVLDGAVDLSLGFEDLSRTQMIGFERAYNAYLEDCRAKDCALAKRGDPGELVDGLLRQVEERALPAPGADRPAGPGETLLGIISAMYSTFTWPQLTRALTDALDGDGTGLVKLTDQYLQRESDGSYPNLVEANSAVNYVDKECPKDPKVYEGLAAEFAKDSPHFGASAGASGLTCAYWTAPASPVKTPKAAGAPPIIVISTTNDPATPYEWGLALAEQLESGVLLTHRGNGHTIYAQGNACIDSAVNAYLLELKVPEEGLTCGNGPPPPEVAATPGATRAPDSTPPPRDATRAPAAPGAPSTGDAKGDGADEVGALALGLVAVALLVAGGVYVAQGRRED